MNKKNLRKIWVLLLVLIMAIGLFPLQVMAATVTINGSYLTIYADGTYNAASTQDAYTNNNALSSGTSGTLNTTSEISRNGNLTTYLAEGADITLRSLYVGGNLTMEGSGVLTADNSSGTGIQVYRKLTVNDGSLTGKGSVAGILVENYPSGGTSITVNSGTLTGIGDTQGICSHDGEVLVKSGTLKGTATDGYGIASNQNSYITVNNGGEVIGTGGGDWGVGVDAYRNPDEGYSILVEGNGRLTGTGNSTGVGALGIIVKGSGYLKGESTAATDDYNADRYGVRAAVGTISVEGNGELHGTAVYEDGYGVYVEAGRDLDDYAEGIMLTGSGKVHGQAPYYAVYSAAGIISIDGSDAQIKGTATATERKSDGSSAIMTSLSDDYDYMTASNDGTIWEHYPNIMTPFNDTTPKHPYENGVNINNISNYSWTVNSKPHLEVSGTGLLALYKYDDPQEIHGTRTKDVKNEIVDLSETGTHRITFYGTLDAEQTNVSEPTPPVESEPTLPTEPGSTPPTESKSPQTGDVNAINLYVIAGLMVISALLIVFIMRKKPKKI